MFCKQCDIQFELDQPGKNWHCRCYGVTEVNDCSNTLGWESVDVVFRILFFFSYCDIRSSGPSQFRFTLHNCQCATEGLFWPLSTGLYNVSSYEAYEFVGINLLTIYCHRKYFWDWSTIYNMGIATMGKRNGNSWNLVGISSIWSSV